MLKKLTIRNFQKHLEQEFELSSGVNVFVGKSGAGKSAGVIRPLKLLNFNRPLGESYRRWGSDETYVDAQFDDAAVCRIKSDKDNVYLLDDGKSDNPAEFRSFGQNPPEAIQSTLNLSPINFQFQHDQLYLLSYSPPEVARVLNELTGLDKIDRAFARIGSRLRKETQETATNKTIKEKLEKDLESYKDLDQLDSSLMVAEQLDQQATDKAIKVSSLKSMATRIRNAEERVRQFDGLGKLQAVSSEAEAKFALFRELSDKGMELLTLAETISSKTGKIRALGRVSGLGKELEKLQTVIIGRKGMELQAKGIRTLASKKLELDLQIGEMELVLEDLHQQFDKEMPEQCPLCGRRG